MKKVGGALAGASVAALFLIGALGGITPASADLPATSTAVTCVPTSIAVYSSTTCTATASSSANFAYTGLFIWSSSIQGSFSSSSAGPYPDSCAVTASGSCSVTFIPLAYTSNPVTITAAYTYDTSHQESTGSATIALTGAISTATSITVVTATSTTTAITTSISTTTIAAAVSVLDVSALVIAVGLLMVLAFIVGEWRRTRHPSSHTAATSP